MENTKLSILGTLISVVNNTSIESLDYQLASYFLDHYNHFDTLNIFDVAERCYCSRISVRRFCQKLGFSNFADMKKHFTHYDHHEKEYTKRLDVSNFRQSTADSLAKMIKEIDQLLDDDRLEEIVEKIHTSQNVIVFVVNTATTMANFFQQEMFFCGKLIKVVTDYTDSVILKDIHATESTSSNSSIRMLNKDDLLITISVTGSFASATLNTVSYCKAHKILLTLNRNAEFMEYYDDIYYLSRNENEPIAFTVYTVYGINYIFDNLFYLYYKRYSGNNQNR